MNPLVKACAITVAMPMAALVSGVTGRIAPGLITAGMMWALVAVFELGYRHGIRHARGPTARLPPAHVREAKP